MSERAFRSRRTTTMSDDWARYASGKTKKLWGSDNRTSEYSCRPRTPFSLGPGIVQMCSRLWRLVRGRRHRVS